MKGKIIKINGDNIVVRPTENFLDISIHDSCYNGLSKTSIGKEVEIEIDKFVNVVIDGIGYYGTLNLEDK